MRCQIPYFPQIKLIVRAFCSSSIRNRLTALKKNRGEYIKSSDVNVLYQAIVKQGTSRVPACSCLVISLNSRHRSLAQSLLTARYDSSTVTRLNEVRDDHTIYNNRLDTTLADVFNLLSLFYLTIGKTRECPATYSQIASMRVSTALCRGSAPTRRQTWANAEPVILHLHHEPCKMQR